MNGVFRNIPIIFVSHIDDAFKWIFYDTVAEGVSYVKALLLKIN